MSNHSGNTGRKDTLSLKWFLELTEISSVQLNEVKKNVAMITYFQGRIKYYNVFQQCLKKVIVFTYIRHNLITVAHTMTLEVLSVCRRRISYENVTPLVYVAHVNDYHFHESRICSYY